MRARTLTTTLTSLALAGGLLLSACGGTASNSPEPGGLTTGSGSPSGWIPLTGGSARVEISGGPTLDLPLNTASSSFFVGFAAASLNYTDPDGNTFGLNGLFATGPTGPTFALTVTTADPIAGYVSNGGECTVTFQSYDQRGAKGTFDCTDIKNLSGSGTSDISGTFDATA